MANSTGSITTGLILAAGKGTRLLPLTLTRPKALLAIGGKPLLEYAIKRLERAMVSKIIVNTHHLADQIESYLKNNYPKIIVSQEKQLLETAGAAMKILDQFGGEPFYAINGDCLWSEPEGQTPALNLLQNAWRPEKMDVLLLLIPKRKAISYHGPGDYFINQNHTLTWRGGIEKAPYVYASAKIVHPRILKELMIQDVKPPVSFKRVFDYAEESGRLFGVIYNQNWYDVGTLEGLKVAHQAYALSHYSLA